MLPPPAGALRAWVAAQRQRGAAFRQCKPPPPPPQPALRPRPATRPRLATGATCVTHSCPCLSPPPLHPPAYTATCISHSCPVSTLSPPPQLEPHASAAHATHVRRTRKCLTARPSRMPPPPAAACRAGVAAQRQGDARLCSLRSAWTPAPPFHRGAGRGLSPPSPDMAACCSRRRRHGHGAPAGGQGRRPRSPGRGPAARPEPGGPGRDGRRTIPWPDPSEARRIGRGPGAPVQVHYCQRRAWPLPSGSEPRRGRVTTIRAV